MLLLQGTEKTGGCHQKKREERTKGRREGEKEASHKQKKEAGIVTGCSSILCSDNAGTIVCVCVSFSPSIRIPA
jgi:hypothetical protein